MFVEGPGGEEDTEGFVGGSFSPMFGHNSWIETLNIFS